SLLLWLPYIYAGVLVVRLRGAVCRPAVKGRAGRHLWLGFRLRGLGRAVLRPHVVALGDLHVVGEELDVRLGCRQWLTPDVRGFLVGRVAGTAQGDTLAQLRSVHLFRLA